MRKIEAQVNKQPRGNVISRLSTKCKCDYIQIGN